MNRLHRLFRMPAWLLATTLVLSACGGGSSSGGGGGGGGAAPAPTPTTVHIVPTAAPSASPSATSSPDAAAFVCPSSDTATGSAVARRSASGDALRHMAPRRNARAAASLAAGAGGTQLVAVTYNAQSAAAQKTTLSLRESALGTLVRQYSFSHTNLVTHVLKVPVAQVASVEASLRRQAGVRSVGLTGSRRYAASVTAPYYPSDPYFTGFANPTAPSSGATAPPSTFETGLDESASVPGQWDMHVTRLEYAFGYSQGSSVGAKPAALGSAAVKIAVIDTGEDTTHPELKTKIAYQKCFITNLDNVQTTSNFTTDPDGHGTDVSGIAGADTGNSFGFTGAGGNVELYGYRVFPTPDDSCTSDTSTDEQCGTATADIASAIEDAVAQHVNVISMSLGGGGCNADGSDTDSVEGGAVADAIAANIVVVAAAGNSSGPPIEAPGCDPSVIAVGATGISDGTPNGSSNTTGSATAPTEYVASYTDYGSPGAAVNSASAWGIVAPGGDPSGDTDEDDLHWIENIWTSAPFGAATGDTSFAGTCLTDYPAESASGNLDCRVLIAGTSMATPHVAGAAALILSVNAGYQSPALMKQLLCQTADDISDANEGCGRLDVYRAMASAVGDADPGPSPAP